jgi:hypothetical protein
METGTREVRQAGIPREFLPLLRLILKNTFRNFFKNLPITIFFALLTYIGYTIFIIFLNNGYDKRDFPGAALLGLGGGTLTGLSGGVIFMLLSGLTVGLLTNAYKKGPGKALVEFFAAPGLVFSYFGQAGDLAMAGLLSGAGISLVTGSVLTGCGNVAMAIGVSMLLFSRAGQVLALLVRSAWGSTYGAVQGVRGSEFGLAAGHVALMGAALGFVVRSVLPRWGSGLGIAFLIIALVLAKGTGKKSVGSTGLFLFSLGACWAAWAGLACAHDGGWKENGGNFWAWIRTFGALVSLLTGLGPAAGIMFGAAFVRALLDVADVADDGLPPELTEEKPPREAPETRKEPQPDLTPLVDPETGQPLLIQDGRYEGGKPGQVWYREQWMDRASAERLIAEKEAEWERDRRRWQDERSGEWEQQVKQQREREGYVYEREKDAYVPGDSHPDVIEEQRRKDAERLDDFIERNVKDLKRQDFLQELVDRVRQNGGDMDALRNAVKDNTVGAEQQLSMGDSESGLAEADAWRDSEEYATEVNKWSQRANRAIGHFVPGIGPIINMLQGGTTGAVQGYEEGGLRGAFTSATAQGVDFLVQHYTGVPGTGMAFRNAYGTEYTRDENGNPISPLDRFVGGIWHSSVDQYDPRVYYDRYQKAQGIGDYVDMGLDAWDAKDDAQNLREKVRGLTQGEGHGDADAETRQRREQESSEPEDGPRRPRDSSELGGDYEGKKPPVRPDGRRLGEKEADGSYNLDADNQTDSLNRYRRPFKEGDVFQPQYAPKDCTVAVISKVTGHSYDEAEGQYKDLREHLRNDKGEIIGEHEGGLRRDRLGDALERSPDVDSERVQTKKGGDIDLENAEHLQKIKERLDKGERIVASMNDPDLQAGHAVEVKGVTTDKDGVTRLQIDDPRRGPMEIPVADVKQKNLLDMENSYYVKKNEFHEDYRAMQEARNAGDQSGADRHAARMLARDYDKFKGMVAEGRIDPDTAERAVRTHQEIIRAGVGEGAERTRRMGALLGGETPDGQEGGKPVIKHTWSPGGGMEPFDPGRPKVSGDTDLTTVLDRGLVKERQLDPDQVQKLAAGHTKDAINKEAARRLGEDMGDYAARTKVKFTPGSDEEYLSFQAHKQEGRVVEQSGSGRTSLGEEMGWSGKLDRKVAGSPTGIAMHRADEHNMIGHTIEERPATGDRYRDGETAREVTKHLDRMGEYSTTENDPANWKPEHVDTSKLNSPEGFERTLEASRTGKPKDIQNAVEQHYGGDYDKFFKDIHEASRQGARESLDEGGKVWDAQKEGLRTSGVEVGRDQVVRHATDPLIDPEQRQGFVSDGDLRPVAGGKSAADLSAGRQQERQEADLLQRMGISERDKLQTPEGRKLYDDLMTRMPDRDEKGRITGWGAPPQDNALRQLTDPESRQFFEKLEAHRERDPAFRKLDDRIRSAEMEGWSEQIKDVESARYKEMVREGTWGAPESDSFREELGRRVRTHEMPDGEDRYAALKHQEHILVRNNVDQEQLATWLKVRDKIRRGETAEPVGTLKQYSAMDRMDSPFGKWDPEDN